MTITIYSKPNCVFCEKAKSMVKNLGFEYEEKMFGKDFKTPDELFEAVGKQVRTMPQIMIDDKHLKSLIQTAGMEVVRPATCSCI